MATPRVCVLRTAGTNCDVETAYVFTQAHADVKRLHINQFIEGDENLKDYQILALPGGFSYADDIASGKIFANELKYKLADQLQKFIADGKLIIGICNGFQVLVKSGILPANNGFEQSTSLIINDSGKFEDRWVYLKSQTIKSQKCVWVRGLPEIIYLPVAHGEGKFVVKDEATLDTLKQNNQIVFQYCDERGELAGYPYNPNGSTVNIAGICDLSGRIFGLMPHPERYVNFLQHPRWKRQGTVNEGDGFAIFKNGVEYARDYL
jgi:phosphoribosylformylglycinamidine synthase